MASDPSSQSALSDSAYRVTEAVGIKNQDDLPGHLYFFVAPGFVVEAPEDQEDARMAMEDFAMRLRIAFQKDEPLIFREFFGRLLKTAQAAFSPNGFRSQALKELPTFQREVVQTAGGRIKARYNWRLVKAVLTASILIILMGLAVEWGAGYGTASSSQEQNSSLEIEAKTSPNSLSQSAKGIGRFVRWDKSFSFSHTGFLLAASMWGLLFASMTRNLDPTFETLLTPDSDLMEPWVRLLFFGIPILILALVFQTQIVAVSFATVSTALIGENVVAAILFGLLLGVSERALPKEVEQLSRKILPSSKVSQ